VILFAPPTLPASLEAILAGPALRGATVSAYVCEMDGTPLYAHNETERMLPASNQKLFTGAFALDALGPDSVQQTRFWIKPDRLVIDSPGDPGLTYDQLLAIKKTLQLDGSKPVYVHQAYRPGTPSSWEWDDLHNRYAAPVTAFTVNRGGVEVWAEKGLLSLFPAPLGITVTQVSVSGPPHVSYDLATDTAKVTGTLPDVRTKLDALAVREPDRQAAKILGTDLFELDQAPSDPPTYVWKGSPLRDLLKECFTISDNIMAENLLLIGAAKSAPLQPDPYPQARAALKDFLATKVGIAADDVHPYDGSGLSRHNLVTARSLAQVLVWESAQPTADIWKGCLDVPGGGTLVGRLEKSSFRGKTGTLEGVAALSGYLQLADGRPVVASFIINDAIADNQTLRDVADSFIRAVEGLKTADFTGSTPTASLRSRGSGPLAEFARS